MNMVEEDFPLLKITCGGLTTPLLAMKLDANSPPHGGYMHSCMVLPETDYVGRSEHSALGEGPGMKTNQWYHLSCRVATKPGHDKLSFNLDGYYGDHDDIRTGFNNLTPGLNQDSLTEMAVGDMLGTEWIQKEAPFPSPEMRKGQRCDVQIMAHNSGVQVHYVYMMSRHLSKREVYTTGSSTPFELLDEY